MKLTIQQKADIVYARFSAVIDFANEVEADTWRKHCLSMHAATWHREFDARVSEKTQSSQLGQ